MCAVTSTAGLSVSLQEFDLRRGDELEAPLALLPDLREVARFRRAPRRRGRRCRASTACVPHSRAVRKRDQQVAHTRPRVPNVAAEGGKRPYASASRVRAASMRNTPTSALIAPASMRQPIRLSSGRRFASAPREEVVLSHAPSSQGASKGISKSSLRSDPRIPRINCRPNELPMARAALVIIASPAV